MRVGRRFARSDADLDHNRRTPLSCSRIITPTPLPALLRVVLRPIDTRPDTAAVVTTLRLRRAIGAHEGTKLSGAPPLLHFPQQLACQRLPATNVGVAVALCLHSDG